MVGVIKNATIIEMKIESYVDYFHDGSVIDIKHSGHNITIDMSSAEMDPMDLVDDVVLSKRDTIVGRLYILGVRGICINDRQFHGQLAKTHDSGSINNLSIDDTLVSLQVSWSDYPPKPRIETDLFEIKIEASKIYWENIPNLRD